MPAVFSVFTDLRTLVLFLLTFTLIVAVHELGHYATARMLGMRVLEFGFGFPPRAASIMHAGIRYSLNWIPFGGFVRIFGQDDFTIHQQGESEPGSFTSKPWWSQAIVLAAGVAMNFVLAIVVLTAAFSLGTTAPNGDVKVVEVAANSPAQAAGIQSGDIVKAIDGNAITSSRGLRAYVDKHTDTAIALQIQRGTGSIEIRATPRADPPEGEGPLGIKLEEVSAPVAVSLPQAVGQAVGLTGDVVGQIVDLPGQLLSRGGGSGQGAPQVGGPIEIFRVTGQVAQFGVPTFLKLIGVLSVNLGVLNIVPFPGLDGGRLFFVLAGALFRRKLSPQVEAAIHAVGFLLLLGVLLVVSLADIRRAAGG